MQIETVVDKKNNLVYRKCSGELNFGDFLKEIHKTLASKDFNPKMDSLWDIRKVNFPTDKFEEAEKFYSLVNNLENVLGKDHKIALWVSSKKDYMSTSLYTALSEILLKLYIVRIFEYKNEIFQWLNLNEQDIDYL